VPVAQQLGGLATQDLFVTEHYGDIIGRCGP
jgi:hypothetical protein